MKKRGLIEDLNDFLIALAIVIVAIVLMHFVIQEKFSKVKGDVELYSDVVDSSQNLAFLNTPVEIDGTTLKVSDWLVLLCYDESKKENYVLEIVEQTEYVPKVYIYCSGDIDDMDYFIIPGLEDKSVKIKIRSSAIFGEESKHLTKNEIISMFNVRK